MKHTVGLPARLLVCVAFVSACLLGCFCGWETINHSVRDAISPCRLVNPTITLEVSACFAACLEWVML